MKKHLSSGTISVNFHPLPVFHLLLPFATSLLSTCFNFCTIVLIYTIPVPGQLCDPAPVIPSFLVSVKFNCVLIIICIFVFFNIMGGALHGSSCPIRTCPFDLITSYYLAHIFHFFSVIYPVHNTCNGQ